MLKPSLAVSRLLLRPCGFSKASGVCQIKTRRTRLSFSGQPSSSGGGASGGKRSLSVWLPQSRSSKAMALAASKPEIVQEQVSEEHSAWRSLGTPVSSCGSWRRAAVRPWVLHARPRQSRTCCSTSACWPLHAPHMPATRLLLRPAVGPPDQRHTTASTPCRPASCGWSGRCPRGRASAGARQAKRRLSSPAS